MHTFISVNSWLTVWAEFSYVNRIHPDNYISLLKNVLLNIFIIHQTHYEKSDWSRAFNQFTIACELDMISIYHVKFNVCLVTKPLGVFSSETEWLNVFFCLLFKKCIIKQLLKSFFAWYHELSKPRVCIICLSLRLRQITQTSVLIIHDIMLNLIQ